MEDNLGLNFQGLLEFPLRGILRKRAPLIKWFYLDANFAF